MQITTVQSETLPQALAARAQAHSGRPLRGIITQKTLIVAVTAAMFGYGVMSLIMTATPLAMRAHAHSFSSTAFVIEWRVLGMFAPSLPSSL